MADETSRGLANIRSMWGVWFDNDGGDLSPEMFARLFPRLRMVIVNSYSCNADRNKWRVFVPTTISMPIAAYNAITGQIMLTVNRAGYWSRQQLDGDPRIKSRRHHGFDMSKLVPSSLFYLPCQAGDPANSFFVDFNDKNRAPLDPHVWAAFAANHVQPERVVIVAPVHTQPMPQPLADTSDPKLRRVRELMHDEQMAGATAIATRQQAAIDKWHSTPAGQGNQAFFQLGVDLNHTGMDHAEIRATLWQEAGHSRHPSERRSQITTIMRTLAQRFNRAVA